MPRRANGGRRNNSLVALLSRSTRAIMVASKRRAPSAPSTTTTTTTTTTAANKRGKVGATKQPRRRVIELTLREFETYARTVSDSTNDGGVPVRFPTSADESTILRYLETTDGSLFSANGCFDERFVTAVNTAFGVNCHVSFAAVARQFAAQCAGSTTSRRWRATYLNDCRLEMFERQVPFVVRVTVGRETDDTPFKRFCKDTFAHPVTLNVGPVLLGKAHLTTGDHSDSLTKIALRGLGARSLFYRRVFLLHLLLWMTVCEGTRRLDSAAGNGSDGIVMVVQRCLRPLVRLPTTMSILLDNDPRLSVYYM